MKQLSDETMLRMAKNAAPYAQQEELKKIGIAALRDDLELIDAVEKEMKFVDDAQLQDQSSPPDFVRRAKLHMIRYFEKAYGNTDQDTVTYGPEFVIVVRSILAGKRPVKLRFLTDFDGEEKLYKKGDIVKHKASFLRSVGWYTDVPINGLVVQDQETADSPVRVHWNDADDGHITPILPSNILPWRKPDNS